MNLRNNQAENYIQRNFISYDRKIRTYRLLNNEIKRVVENYGDNKNSLDELDEVKSAANGF
jgi:hypothetical protein